MKRLAYVILCLLCASFSAFSQDYYWYKGKQIPLQRGNQRYILYEEDNAKDSETLQIIQSDIVQYSKDKNLKWGIVAQNAPIRANNVVYQIPSFLRSDTTQNMYVTHRFYVKLKNMDDYALLLDYSSRYNAEIEQEGDFPLWYIMRCGLNAQYNALELANIFYESRMFDVSEPEFINVIERNCVNDPDFFLQWNLQNTGTYGPSSNGIDINYCAVHSITTGDPSVIIGVYDNGVDMTHPDINIHPYSYNADTQSSPSQIYTNVDIPFHATACAGIIGGKANNNIGVAGIAPNCPVMSISFGAYTSVYKIGQGIKVATNNGCSVICNPWGTTIYSAYINEGISYALSNGREGKGCVVVFPAGNDNNNYVDYPAEYNDSIIVVGAASPCAQRKKKLSCDGENWWASNYGNKLDVMAPGVIIPTTDIVGFDGATSSNYLHNFRGTSAACAHVAAVAGLILSVRPDLTQKEVADIIESTAQKVGNYAYSTHSGRPNGTWNNEMGYGLVDAYEAVIAATDGYIQGPDYVCDTTKYYLWKTPSSGSTISWSLSNATGALWNYSIVGPANQDTVYVKCIYSNPPLTNNRLDVFSNQPAARNFIPTLSVTISNGTLSQAYNKQFRMPTGDTPAFSTNSTGIWYARIPRTFTITNCTDVPDSALTWTVENTTTFPNSSLPPVTSITTYTGRSITYNPPYVLSGGICIVEITATNTLKECGDNSSTRAYLIKNKVLLTAYSEDDIFRVIISEETGEGQSSPAQLEDNSDYMLELRHSIYGRMKEQTVHSANVQTSTNNLPRGVYVLMLKENGKVIAQAKVQIQ